MKRSTIWLLTIVMAVTIMGLLGMQIMYMENMVKMRNEQFDENVTRSLFAVAGDLEQDETRYYLDQDIDKQEALTLGGATEGLPGMMSADGGLTDSSLQVTPQDLSGAEQDQEAASFNLNRQYQRRQDMVKAQYLNQKGLLNELIISIMSQSSLRPIRERADSATVSFYLKQELANNGLKLPYEFAITNAQSGIVYSTSGFSTDNSTDDVFAQMLFPNDPSGKQNTLKVTFPTKSDYIFSSIKFMIPSFIFTLILITLFIYSIVMVFRQKKLSEMKNDFINNMTHEFKTPISTISLAAQMLNDDSVAKSPQMLKHVSGVINDETKRLRFQVEKVLQVSLFDRKSATMRLADVDANEVINNVVNTFKIKAEKYGGTIDARLDAEDSIVEVDEMHFTNVIYNLLDNAIKYRRDDVAPHLTVTTKNLGDDKLEISIKDNGIGMKREDLKKIFEKFYRVSTGNRHDVKGFGLGLAYVSKMVSLFKGTIKAESELGKGSTFIITLPLYN